MRTKSLRMTTGSHSTVTGAVRPTFFLTQRSHGLASQYPQPSCASHLNMSSSFRVSTSTAPPHPRRHCTSFQDQSQSCRPSTHRVRRTGRHTTRSYHERSHATRAGNHTRYACSKTSRPASVSPTDVGRFGRFPSAVSSVTCQSQSRASHARSVCSDTCSSRIDTRCGA